EPHSFADRALIRREDLLANRRADDADIGARRFLGRSEAAAFLHLDAACVHELVADALDLAAPVLPVVERNHVAFDLAGDEIDSGDLLAYRLDVAFVERAELPAVGLDREDEGHGRAERADLPLDVGGDALAERDHRDHRGDADDDAERGEEAAQDVAPDLAEGQQQRRAEHQCAPAAAPPSGAPDRWPRSIRSTSPSLK